MAENVTYLDVSTTLDIPVDRVLDGVKDERLEKVAVIGRTEDGDIYLASSVADARDILWLLEKLKLRILNAELE